MHSRWIKDAVALTGLNAPIKSVFDLGVTPPLSLQRGRPWQSLVLLEASRSGSQCESSALLSWSLLSPGCISLTKAPGWRS